MVKGIVKGAAVTSCLMLLLSSGVAFAQDAAASYPNKVARIIVGNSPGGGIDLTARLMAEGLSRETKKSFIVENRPGAQGDVASEAVAKAEPDGYTILMVSSTFAINAASGTAEKFDPIKDFAAVTELSENPQFVLVQPSVGVNTLAELIAYGKKNPGKLNVASTGQMQELLGSEFARQAGIKVTQVPYNGAGAALTALLSDEVGVYFGSTMSSSQYVSSGQVKALAVTAEGRTDGFPNVPTIAEAGMPDFKLSTWYGFFVPAKTPPAVVAKLQALCAKVLAEPDIKERLLSSGGVPLGTKPAEFQAYLGSEIDRLKTLLAQHTK